MSPRTRAVSCVSALSLVLPVTACAARQNPVGAQPQGSLSGKIVYLHSGHGLTASNLSNGAWAAQRPETFEMVEDLGNQDGMTFLAEYLWRAGATIAPLRPMGHQPNEVIIDNDDAEAQFNGAWNSSNESVFFGDSGDVPFMYASASTIETSYARYTPNISQHGFYPVYVWTAHGPDRVRQLYRITHSGGTTEVTVDHRKVGSGLVYLGAFHLDAGSSGYVDISNRSDDTGVVIADMIRFGNGMGDINRAGGISGVPREDEAGLYWVMWHVDRCQGIPDSEYRASDDDRTATVSLSPRYSEYMNREASGTLSDRVFISYHSNAGGGSARGVLGLLNGNNNPATATPNMLLLADTVAREVNDDLVSLAGSFEHNWFDRTVLTLDRTDIEFGEINNIYIGDEFDATIIETGFHDNQQDAEMLRDPNVRDALARATCQGLVKYFNAVDGGATPLAFLPGAVSHERAISNGDSTITLSWTSPGASDAIGDAATGYRIYTSLDGYGFDGGVDVPGGETTSHLISGLEPADGMHYFRIAAVNAGGESPWSSVVCATPRPVTSRILIVNGFDRLSRPQNPRVPYGSGGNTIDRVRPRFSNSFDYAVQVGEAIEAYSATIGVDSTQNEAVIDGSVELDAYDTVIWILGEESSADDTFDATEQSLVSNFQSGGGDVILSGTEIGWDLYQLNGGRDFYNDVLHADYVADDANSYSVQGAAGSIFAGLSFAFDNGSTFYDANYPDVISPLGGAQIAMNYVGGAGGGAAIQYDGIFGEGDVVMLAFPFETILGAQNRADVMAAMLDFVAPCAADTNGDGAVNVSDLLELLAAWGPNPGHPADINDDGTVNVSDLLALLAAWGPC